MKKKLIALFVSVLMVVVSLPAVALASDPSVLANEPSLEHQEIMPFDSFYFTIFEQGWLSNLAVPISVNRAVTRNGRVYQGILTRNGAPIQDAFGTWGGVFSGIVRFTGIVQWSFCDASTVEYENLVIVLDIEHDDFDIYTTRADVWSIHEPVVVLSIEY